MFGFKKKSKTDDRVYRRVDKTRTRTALKTSINKTKATKVKTQNSKTGNKNPEK